jgi:hypothetical protein
MANLTNNYYSVTEDQLAACERHVNSHGNPFYTCKSATDPDTTYTLRWHQGYKMPSCNCQAAYDGRQCWHFRAVLACESIHQDEVESEARAAALREQKAIKRDGAQAYDRKPFSLLKSA